MIFSELYGVYYNTVAKIISAAISGTLNENTMKNIISTNAFSESVLYIIPAIKTKKWQLLNDDFSTPIKNLPSIPLTNLQKSWLKAILSDKRIQLFEFCIDGLDDVEPLFTEEDYRVFDSYSDGDNYNDEQYIKNFRLILDAIKNDYALKIEMLDRNNHKMQLNVKPHHLEYSEKDDKFRLITTNGTYGNTINLSRILFCNRYNGNRIKQRGVNRLTEKSVTLEIIDERNALERVMMNFSHFKRQSERIGDNRYKVTIFYNSSDESEIVIRVLSFGAMVKVCEPENFKNLIRQKLKAQKNCGLFIEK